MLSWAVLLVAVMAADTLTPKNVWGALLCVPVNFASVPAFTWTGMYFAGGPRHARRFWLTWRFVFANMLRPGAIIDRGMRRRERHRPRSRTIYPFWWANSFPIHDASSSTAKTRGRDAWKGCNSVAANRYQRTSLGRQTHQWTLTRAAISPDRARITVPATALNMLRSI